jgi:hypothetical protein
VAVVVPAIAHEAGGVFERPRRRRAAEQRDEVAAVASPLAARAQQASAFGLLTP